MLSVEHARWGQTPEDLRRLAMSAPHRRTRERFLALYDIVQGSRGATCVALRAGRHPQTVMGWLHAYDAHGPDALVYRRSGGRPPLYGALPVKKDRQGMCLCSMFRGLGRCQRRARTRRTLYPVGSHRAGPLSRIQRGRRPR
ncbi:MAG: helix-turn-helix domain-containing protein [Actinomycetota bacterium]|nr:helix-turn-helix domain-containing protein [Actinomycetota bacterium]